jgi:type II secretory pathway pseudopilin PulG
MVEDVDALEGTDVQGVFNSRKATAFTLDELLIVIAIMVTLSDLLLPVLQMLRESSRRTVCLSNLRGAGTALRAYALDDNDSLPAVYGPTYWLWDIPK